MGSLSLPFSKKPPKPVGCLWKNYIHLQVCGKCVLAALHYS